MSNEKLIIDSIILPLSDKELEYEITEQEMYRFVQPFVNYMLKYDEFNVFTHELYRLKSNFSNGRIEMYIKNLDCGYKRKLFYSFDLCEDNDNNYKNFILLLNVNELYDDLVKLGAKWDEEQETLTLPTKRYGELLVIIAQIDNDIVICSLCKDGAPIFVIDDIEEFLNIYKSHYI